MGSEAMRQNCDREALIDNRSRNRGLLWTTGRSRTVRTVCLIASMIWSARAGAQTKAPGDTVKPTVTVDHQPFDALLHRFVVNGMVDYDGFARAPEFGTYLASLNAVRPERLSEDERLAFWINTYNAFTIQLIVSHHETETIRNINKTLGVLRLKGPWSEPIVRAAGRVLTLDDVHHSILRKEFGEPRVHFALACGAMGCPVLRSEAYTGAKLVDQLNEQGRVFLSESPSKNHFERQGLVLSPVIMSFRSDFGEGRVAVLKALAPYFNESQRKSLESGRMWAQAGAFDWTLNSQAKAKELKAAPTRPATVAPPSR